MKLRPQDLDTIAAIATPPGRGGISVVRCSGEKSVESVSQFCSFLKNPESHRSYFGYFKTLDGENVDEVVVSYFEKGRSFTSEETIEISCHGNPLICQKIISCLNSVGVRQADAGEFTYRAYMNGRIDLVQAEGVLQLIESESEKAHEKSIGLLRGDLSKKLFDLKDKIIWILANLEAGIDFIEEDLEISEIPHLVSETESSLLKIDQLLQGFRESRLAFDGVTVSLSGLPNSGKSSLMNALAGEEVAIVSEHEGTTRDVLKAKAQWRGYQIELVDCAGLRESDNPIERQGIELARQWMKRSDLALFLISPDLPLDEQIGLFHDSGREDMIIVISKSDLLGEDQRHSFYKSVNSLNSQRVLFCSSLDALSTNELKNDLGELVEGQNVDCESGFLSRHFHQLGQAKIKLNEGLQLIRRGESPEFVVSEVNEALSSVKSILGESFEDDVMNRVFSEFCIGK